MIPYKSILFILALSILVRCTWFEKSEHVKIIYDYEVGWNDLVRNRAIIKPIKECKGCYEVIIECYVYAIGHNEDFIIAKQNSSLDTVNINYFIIDTKANSKSSKSGIYGPLNENEFDSLTKRFNISGLSFNLNYPISP